MTLQVRSSAPVAAAAAAVGPTDFIDVMAGTDQPYGIGDDWFSQFSSSPSVDTVESGLDANVNRSGTGLRFGSNQMMPRVKFFPIPVDHREIRAQSVLRGQRSKWTHVSSVYSGGNSNVGVMVFGEANRGNEYLLDRTVSSGNVTLYRNLSDGTGTSAVLISNVFNIGAGDDFEIRAFYAPAGNTIQCLKNGVIIATWVDSDVGRPVGGLYGIHYFGNGAGASNQIFRDYSGGVV